MAKVYVTVQLPQQILQPLLQHDVTVWQGETPVPDDVLESEVSEVEGLLTILTDRIDAELLDKAPHLRIVSQMAVGVDNIDLAACHQRGIIVGHTPDVLTGTVADHAFALLGAIARRLPEGEREVRAGEWGPWQPFHLTGGDLHETVLGIVGMGRIGREVARRASGYDMEVIYSSPGTGPGERVDLPELLRRSDHVILCCALNDETRGLIGTRELELMKPTAYLVNVSRGPVVKTDDLADALQRGSIAGAALDVTDPEPLPSDHRLLDLPGCLVVPHIASASVRTRTAMASLAVENLLNGLEGKALRARFPSSA